MEFKNKSVLVVGMARSGIAAAQILNKNGAKVTIYDQKKKDKLKDLDIDYILGEEPEINKQKYQLVVTSPGVPLTALPLAKAQLEGIPIIGELELAYTMCKSPIIGVTGTNGKTTTTALIGEILKKAGLNAKVAGNIGIPLIQEVSNSNENNWLVVEVSSFQLETINKFHPKVAVLLNITPDHLDRHKTFENYIQAKMQIFKNQDRDDYAVINYDDLTVSGMSQNIKSKVIFFSKNHKLNQGVFYENGKIIVNWEQYNSEIISWNDVKLKGMHNLENVMAAVAAAIVLNIKLEDIKNTLKNFAGVPHRLEPVGKVGEVEYINDSKGTNPDATIKAIEAYNDRDIVLIAGGMDKGSSFDELAKVMAQVSCRVVVFGETAEKIKEAANSVGVEVFKVNNLEEAVSLSNKIAIPGGVVLLSPACASWDMYSSFEERGEHFRGLVKQLMG